MTAAAVFDDAGVFEALSQFDPRMQEISARIFDTPELAFQETAACALLVSALEEHGFTIERNVAELPTAFRATYRGGAGPVIALLAEYDALPEIGHGCGHNLIAASSVGAALALVTAWPDVPGTLTVIGCPAEEGGGGKIIMLNAGVFDDVDASMMFHPDVRDMVNKYSYASQRLDLAFHGRSAHAAKSPWLGIDAASTAMLFFAGVNALRGQSRPGSSMHGYLAEGGRSSSIIPDRAAVEVSVRAHNAEDLAALSAQVLRVADGAAMMLGATVEHSETAPYLEYRHSASFGACAAANLRRLGVEPVPAQPDLPRASADAGNVSHVVPHLCLSVAIAGPDTPGHSVAYRDSAGSPAGAQAVRIAAGTLALTAADLFRDPVLLETITAEHALVRSAGE